MKKAKNIAASFVLLVTLSSQAWAGIMDIPYQPPPPPPCDEQQEICASESGTSSQDTSTGEPTDALQLITDAFSALLGL